MRWRAWYSGGRSYDSTSHSVEGEAAMLDGVLHFMLYPDGGGRRIMQGTEYYFKAGDVWGQAMASDYPPGTPAAVAAGIRARYPAAIVMRGKDVPDLEYKDAQGDAYASTRP